MAKLAVENCGVVLGSQEIFVVFEFDRIGSPKSNAAP